MHSEKIFVHRSRLVREVNRIRALGKHIVLTNGCFDILHRGHVEYLQQARALGDALIIGVNTDASVRRLKGPERPINALDDRLEVLSALECVDYVIGFSESTAVELVKVIQPDVYVKGGDYATKDLPEAAWAEMMGGRVELIPYIPSQSTTEIIQKIRDRQPELLKSVKVRV